jgi:hypothetical protein
MTHPFARLAALAAACAAATAGAQTISNVGFVNGFAISGSASDLSGGSGVDSRLGFFSDIYYDPNRNEWWGLSDRGPGGGVLNYETRVQRFTLDVAANGAISNFQVAQTIRFTSSGSALNGRAPNPSGTLGNSFDPEGFVINPANGHLLVSDEYGPTVAEFDRSGQLVRRYTVPANMVPKAGSAVDYNAAPPALTAGREPNRGFEGLAISPDGKFAYAVLQNGTLQDGWTSSNRGQYTRIVKFDTATGEAVGQYAYKLESSGQGRGISALVALGNDRFMILERNNRGVGVGATLATADKNVFVIDLAGASDVTNLALPAAGDLPAGVTAVAKGAKVIDLDADTLAALGNKSPEKWEGLAVGPKLANESYLVLAGTDNDYSVTQNGSGTQFDVWFRMNDSDPYASSIQCPIDTTAGCTFTSSGAAAALSGEYTLLPGVLHAYTADIAGYAAPVPEPGSWALLACGLGALGFVRATRSSPRRRASRS